MNRACRSRAYRVHSPASLAVTARATATVGAAREVEPGRRAGFRSIRRLCPGAREGNTMGIGMRSARIALALLSSGIGLTFLVAEAEAGVCRQEYCAKRAPVYSKCKGFLCFSRTVRKGDCLK